MNLFLRLKHWQLFLLVVGVSLIMDFILMGSIVFFDDPSSIFILFPVVMIISAACFFTWLYALGVNLYKKLPKTVKMNLTRFKTLLLIAALYSVFFFIFWINIKKNFMLGQSLNTDMLKYFMPLHLVAMFCIFYCLYFIAKALKSVELQGPVSFNDFASEFFQLLFYPIGIWIIQPKINNLFSGKQDISK